MRIRKIAANGGRVTLGSEAIPKHIWEEALKIGIGSLNSMGSLAYAFKMRPDKSDIEIGMFIDSTQFVSWNPRTKETDFTNPLIDNKFEKWDGYLVLNQKELDEALSWVEKANYPFDLASPEELYRELGIK